MRLSIGGKRYEVSRGDGVATLESPDGTVYHVTDTGQGQRPTCNCADFHYRHAEKPDSPGCKHVQAVVAAGLFETIGSS